ncbi:hypothetical protein TWF225_010321 [Orbilia oligospora]|nr:hypothetical protein TWF225_010321 [Orbilia oligospora]KAF3251620.1 hypothetical protein TWF217_007958 [Orbilia oligospora]KAF3277624.1 hypothetical protein TWF132_001436 [Orbilia oligospora]
MYRVSTYRLQCLIGPTAPRKRHGVNQSHKRGKVPDVMLKSAMLSYGHGQYMMCMHISESGFRLDSPSSVTRTKVWL